LWEHTMMMSDHHDPNALDNMKLWKRYCFHKFIMSSCYGKDVTEMQSLVCADDELQTKKIIKFRLGGRAHSLTLLEFARRLGLYQVVELEEVGFNVYFERGLRSDEHFNAQDYWLSISQEENLGLSRSYTFTIKTLILRVIHKMVTYGLCQRKTGYDKMKRKGAGTQKESQICCGHFISKIARKCRVLTEDVPGVPRVGILRPLRASMYQGAFEHMAGVYSVPMQGAYNPPGYAQPQYDQYYQQYPPPPPQYQQQQQDDDE
ncbi:hypothetical protein Tco_1575285, partial [Tanacetum coccineum]